VTLSLVKCCHSEVSLCTPKPLKPGCPTVLPITITGISTMSEYPAHGRRSSNMLQTLEVIASSQVPYELSTVIILIFIFHIRRPCIERAGTRVQN
jgi:hypothetical protein